MRPWLRKLHRIWVVTGAVGTVVFVAYMLLSYRASGAARDALRSDGTVRLARSATHTTFTPGAQRHSGALLFFSGALVDPAAYAPLLRRVAERGYVAVLLPLPARSAPTGRHEREAVSRALTIMEASPSLRWVVGGHSKGGAVASILARDHPRSLDGLLLVGTSHPREFSLSTLRVPVVKVYGSRDGLASAVEVRQYAGNLPGQTRFVEIEGGNHAQFGYYGFQLGDRRATLSREEQQKRLLQAVLELLRQVSTGSAAR